MANIMTHDPTQEMQMPNTGCGVHHLNKQMFVNGLEPEALFEKITKAHNLGEITICEGGEKTAQRTVQC